MEASASVLAAELAKPLDGSDLANGVAAHAEVMRLRKLMKVLSVDDAAAAPAETADELSRDSLVCGWAGAGFYSMGIGRNAASLLVESDATFAVKMTNGYNERSVTGVGRVVGVEARCVRREFDMVLDLTFELRGNFEGNLPPGVEAPKMASSLKEWCHCTTHGEMMEPAEDDEEFDEARVRWEASEAHFFTEMFSFPVPAHLCPPLRTEQEEQADRFTECKEPVRAWVLEAAAAFAKKVQEMRDYELEEWGQDGWVAQMTAKLKHLK